MASMADVFSEKERTNWLKAWLAIDIAKAGLQQFVQTEAQNLHTIIYNSIWSNMKAPSSCISCNTANMLKCPTLGLCNKREPNRLCTAIHDTLANKSRPCPRNVCDQVRDKIKKYHRYERPSWKCTSAKQWASNPWEIAKCYFPPDGYDGRSSIQDTDFNGIISFLLNYKPFDQRFSFCIKQKQTDPPCLLTKARDICKAVRHTSVCKVTDIDLHGYFTTLTDLLSDPKSLAQDSSAQDAVLALQKLQNDRMSLKELCELIKEAYHTLDRVKEAGERFSKEAESTLAEALQTLETSIRAGEQRIESKTQLGEQRIASKINDGIEDIKRHVHGGITQMHQAANKSEPEDYERCVADLRQRLVKYYNDTTCNVPLSTLDLSLDKRITDIYTTPKIHLIEIQKDGNRIIREQVLTYKELFYTGDQSKQRIYIQGEPGCGKSTFAVKLVHDWCYENQLPSSAAPVNTHAFDDRLTIQKFKFLFFITLRDSRDQTDVTQMIKKQLIDNMFSEDERADVYTFFVQIMKTEICLIVREGLDEWTSPINSNLAEPSMAGFPKDTCTILTTSRPWKLADERIKNSQIDSLFEIDGISDPYSFSENILQCKINQTEDLVYAAICFPDFVERHNLESLSSSPMLYAVVICTWVDTIWEEEHLKGSSLCALYTTLLESLCKKANGTTGYFNVANPPPVQCFSSTSYIKPNIEHVDKLAEVACKLLFSSERESSIVFNDITLSNYVSQKEFTVLKTFALNAGILTNRKDKSRTGSSNSFVHKTMQEFLAAYHIACNLHVIDDVISRYLKCNNNSYLEISQVFIFLCGINIFAANALSALMNECDRHYAQSHCPCPFQKIIESGIKEAAANEQNDIRLKLSNFYITDSKRFRDLYMIWSTNTSNAKSLTMKFVGFVDTAPSLLARDEPTSQYEFNLSRCPNLKSLHLFGNSFWLRDTASSVTSELPICITLNSSDPPPLLPCIEYIYLQHGVTCSSTFLRSLLSTLLKLEHVVTCILEGCIITSCVADAVSETSTYTMANIYTSKNTLDIYICRNESPGLWEALHGLNIKTMTLSLNRLKENHLLKYLPQSLVSLKQLETLTMDVFDGRGLWDTLHGLNIKSLTLSSDIKRVDIHCVESFAESLSSFAQLETLTIKAYDSPGLLAALHGLNIKSLTFERIHDEPFSKPLSSLEELETLNIIAELLRKSWQQVV